MHEFQDSQLIKKYVNRLMDYFKTMESGFLFIKYIILIKRFIFK
jgi:hypothetical protein